MQNRRERLATALLRIGADIRLDRLAIARGIETRPADAPGRDLALASLQFGAWVDTAVLWLGWRLYPRDSLTGG